MTAKRLVLSLAAAALLAGSGAVVHVSYFNNAAVAFYAGLATAAAALYLFLHSLGATRLAGVHPLARTILACALLLPLGDLFTRREAEPVKPGKPVYSVREAKGDPDAFYAWWDYFAGQWIGGLRKQVEAPDPYNTLPYILAPNSSAKFFDSTVRINNLGFRGPDIAAEQKDHYQIFVIGESPTFGTTLQAEELPWPDMLQELIDRRLRCERPVMVINAAVYGYNLEQNLERLKRDVLPLQPDMVLSYHGANSIQFLQSYDEGSRLVRPAKERRPSPIVAELELRLKFLFYERAQERLVATVRPDAELMRSKLAKLYRDLIGIAQEQGFKLVLATSSFAVNASSPPQAIDFYTRVFPNIRWAITANADNRKVLKSLSSESGIPVIDTTTALDGQWDADLFLDPVHFTKKGSAIMAERIFEDLKPLLSSDRTLGCS